MLLAHLSDIHILDLTGVRFYRFLNKRITGGLNLLLRRSKSHDETLLEEALEVVESLGCDHVIVTGDLTNLSLDQEFDKARRILEAHVPTSRLSVIAGNHDRYTLGAALSRRFERHFQRYIRTDLPELPEHRGWPYVKLIDEHVALVGVNTGVAQPWLVSGGRVGERQRQALAAALDHEEVRCRYSVVALHHHLYKPDHKPREFPRGLFDREKVIEVLLEHGADMVIHGHNHHYAVVSVPREAQTDGGSMLVCEAGSATVAEYSADEFAGKFNIYQIDDDGLENLTTYIYRPGRGFLPWKQWTMDEDNPVPVGL